MTVTKTYTLTVTTTREDLTPDEGVEALAALADEYTDGWGVEVAPAGE